MTATPSIQYCNITDSGIILINGKDAATFLQGQLTCDIAALQPQHMQLAGYCNRQGRLQAILYVFCLIDDNNEKLYLLYLPTDIINHCLTQLKKYAAFSKVALADASQQWRCAGLFVPKGTTSIADLALPTNKNNYCINNNCIIGKIAEERYILLYQDTNNATLTWLSQQGVLVSQQHFQCAQIQDGIASIHAPTIEAFTPHHVNLPLVNGVSFNKGCYLGQEVVARMQHLGKLKQHGYYATGVVNNHYCINDGDEIIIQNEPNKTIGHVICHSQIEDTCHLLLSLQDSALNATLTFKKSPSIILQLHKLPYSW